MLLMLVLLFWDYCVVGYSKLIVMLGIVEVCGVG